MGIRIGASSGRTIGTLKNPFKQKCGGKPVCKFQFGQSNKRVHRRPSPRIVLQKPPRLQLQERSLHESPILQLLRWAAAGLPSRLLTVISKNRSLFPLQSQN